MPEPPTLELLQLCRFLWLVAVRFKKDLVPWLVFPPPPHTQLFSIPHSPYALSLSPGLRQIGGGGIDGPGSVLAVLTDPPRKVPRSPTSVTATLAELRCCEPEDAVPSVEVRWRVPSQASLLPSFCGDVERYYIKCWCRGKAKEVMPTTTTVDVPRRDFCRNQVSASSGENTLVMSWRSHGSVAIGGSHSPR